MVRFVIGAFEGIIYEVDELGITTPMPGPRRKLRTRWGNTSGSRRALAVEGGALHVPISCRRQLTEDRYARPFAVRTPEMTNLLGTCSFDNSYSSLSGRVALAPSAGYTRRNTTRCANDPYTLEIFYQRHVLIGVRTADFPPTSLDNTPSTAVLLRAFISSDSRRSYSSPTLYSRPGETPAGTIHALRKSVWFRKSPRNRRSAWLEWETSGTVVRLQFQTLHNLQTFHNFYTFHTFYTNWPLS